MIYGTVKGKNRGVSALYVSSFDCAFEFKEESILLAWVYTNYYGVGKWEYGFRCCQNHYLLLDIYNLEDSQLPPYPHEIIAQQAEAAKNHAAIRSAKGLPADVSAYPFCNQNLKSYRRVFTHLIAFISKERKGKTTSILWTKLPLR